MLLLTVQKEAQAQFSVERSRFICTLKKVGAEAEALAAISAIKKQYWDATHNCSAYIIGADASCQKSSDDGEPPGTAGIPMLEVLKKNRLHDVLAVVTRYFGGIKLGSGGLARAYSHSVAAAVAAAGIAKKELVYDCRLTVSLPAAGKLLNSLYHHPIFSVTGVDYGEDAAITLRLRAGDLKPAEKLLCELSGRPVTLTAQAQSYSELPLSKEEARLLCSH